MSNPQQSKDVALAGPRIKYRPEAHRYGITEEQWATLVNAVYPAAKTPEGVMMAIGYCKARGLDIFKKPIHIVPHNTKIGDKWVTLESIWPGISELRTTAFRTGKYAGCDAAVFGPDVTHTWEVTNKNSDYGGGDEHPNAPPTANKAPAKSAATIKVSVTFPEWCQVTVYRLLGEQRVAFPGPRVYWLETYATQSRNNESPNEMWKDRARGQIEKCAEAAALRKAFPEELGGDYTVDEAPRMVDVTPQSESAPAARPEKTEAPKVEHKPEPTLDIKPKPKPEPVVVEAAKAEIKPEPKPVAVEAKPEPKVENSEDLEHALSALAKAKSIEEIDGMRETTRDVLGPTEYPVWNYAALEKTRTLTRGR